MQVRVLFFGGLREILARDSEAMELPERATVADLLHHFMTQTPQAQRFTGSLAVAVNREYAVPTQRLREADEVALLPPVSGGTDDSGSAAAPLVRLQREPIDSTALPALLKAGTDGAVVVFDGIVRDNTRGRRTLYLDYEAYESMALEQMRALAAEAKQRFGVRQAVVVHRLGRLQVGETSVWIAVASAHRAAAFEACRWIIDTLKQTVPIWKKEFFEDGAVWPHGEPFPAAISAHGHVPPPEE